MSDKALDKLSSEIKTELDARKANAKAEKELAALAKKYGADTIKKLAASTKARGRAATKKRGKVAPVYRNPDNHQQSWTGRGRSPAWVADAEAKHGGREALKIANQ